MGARGASPKPTAIRRLEGITKPCKMPKNEPVPRIATSANCPVALNEKQQLVWDSIAPELMRVGVLSILDIPAFVRYINITLEYDTACDRIKEEGYTYEALNVKGDTVRKTNPYLKIRDAALESLLRLEKEFGMTPSARTRVMAILGGIKNPGGGDGDDPFDV